VLLDRPPTPRATHSRIPPTPETAPGPLALALILAASFLVILDFSIVNVAMPSIQTALHFPAGGVQWVVTAYAITFGGLLIAGGRLADQFGRRRIFVIGLIGFALASLAASLAGDAMVLVAARAVQGVAAAAVAPAALSLITTGFPEGARRTRALGLYAATASVGFVAGQVLGGVLVEFASWKAVFLVNVPIALIVAGLASRHVPEGRGASRRLPLDLGGAALITGATAAVVFAVSEGQSLGWTSMAVMAALVLAVLGTAGFVAVERRHAHPLLRLDLLRIPSLRSANLLTFLTGLWSAGEMLVLSLYLQQNLHDSPLATGMIIAPQGIVGFTAGMFGARLAARIGIRRVLVLTGSIATLGFALLTFLPASGSYSPTLAAVTLVGFGTAGTVFGATVLAVSGIAANDQGVVGGVINTARQIGAALGAALLLAIADGTGSTGDVGTVGGDREAMLAGAVAAAAATLTAWRSGRGPVPASAGPAPALLAGGSPDSNFTPHQLSRRNHGTDHTRA
jgi:EmrB/QacA subfamily drug resistance transporter